MIMECDYRVSDYLNKPGGDMLSALIQLLVATMTVKAREKRIIGSRGNNICMYATTGQGIVYCDYPFNDQTNCPRVQIIPANLP
jgi:hypothetical protein